jgi:hypothetical protein
VKESEREGSEGCMALLHSRAEKLAIQLEGFEGATDWQPISDWILINIESREWRLAIKLHMKT